MPKGLNVGGGGGNTSKICIRLRPARDERSFMDYESLLGTMLHELAHNMVSPHNVSFYKLLDELRKVRCIGRDWRDAVCQCRSVNNSWQPG